MYNLEKKQYFDVNLIKAKLHIITLFMFSQSSIQSSKF